MNKFILKENFESYFDESSNDYNAYELLILKKERKELEINEYLKSELKIMFFTDPRKKELNYYKQQKDNIQQENFPDRVLKKICLNLQFNKLWQNIQASSNQTI